MQDKLRVKPPATLPKDKETINPHEILTKALVMHLQ